MAVDPMLRTNRPLLNEFLYGRWCLFKAMAVQLVTFRELWTFWDERNRLIRVQLGDKIYYEYGGNDDVR